MEGKKAVSFGVHIYRIHLFLIGWRTFLARRNCAPAPERNQGSFKVTQMNVIWPKGWVSGSYDRPRSRAGGPKKYPNCSWIQASTDRHWYTLLFCRSVWSIPTVYQVVRQDCSFDNRKLQKWQPGQFWCLQEDEIQAFQELKAALISSLVLALPKSGYHSLYPWHGCVFRSNMILVSAKPSGWEQITNRLLE